MRFRQFFEFAAYNFEPVAHRAVAYYTEAERSLAELRNKRNTGYEQACLDFMAGVRQLASLVTHYKGDANIVGPFRQMYEMIRKHMEQSADQNEDYREGVRADRLDTKLFLLMEMVEDIAKGRQPEPA